MCSIQRPLDTKTHPRIAVEAEAILGVLTLCEAGQVDLMTSDTLVFELERNPHPVRKTYALEVLTKAKVSSVPYEFKVIGELGRGIVG